MGDADLERATPGATAPYRAPPATATPVRGGPAFVYSPLNEAGGFDAMIEPFRIFVLPIMVTTVLGAIAGAEGAIAGLVGTAAANGVYFWRTRKHVLGAVLRVAGDMVNVAVKGPAVAYERFRLSELADVTLEIKTIERVIEGAGPIPDVRLAESKVGSKLETARIVLVMTSGREVRLTDPYLPHFDSTAWLGKIRLFLRRHGWVPEDEQEASTEVE
jgi:hypothetical protein